MNHETIEHARVLIAKVLEVAPDDVVDEADFHDDLDADSLALAEIVAVLEDELGVETPDPPANFAEVRGLLTEQAVS